jgi:hypothetical protein
MLAALLLALTAATSHPYRPCSHLPDQPGPAVADAAGQTEVRTEIAAAVDGIGGSAGFARYLLHVAARESTLRPGVIHQLDRDRVASAAAYRRLRGAHRRAGNPYADRPELWLTYGLFGMNSNYHTRRVHPHADPRALCRVNVSVAAYAIATQDVLRRMRRSCVRSPTWADVHRAIQRGDLCPDGRRENLPAAIADAPARLADVGG